MPVQDKYVLAAQIVIAFTANQQDSGKKLDKKGSRTFCSASLNSSLLAEIWKSQTCGRLIFALLAHRYNYKHDDCDNIRQHLKQLL